TEAKVHLTKGDAGFTISRIDLQTEATIPGIDDAKFQEIAAGAKAGCPVSRALTGVEINLDAKLVG
ncbi:MAG: OsmC family protein, partial [Bacteroidota bacterium]